MTCGDCQALAPLYLSGELDAARSAEFLTHLESCGACAGELRRTADADSRLREAMLGESVDTDDLNAQIRQGIQITARPGRRLAWAAAIGLAASLAIGIYTYRTSTAPDPVCIAAATDHHREVLSGQPRKWLLDTAAIQTLAAGQGIESGAIDRLAAAGLHLEQGKLCRLDGHVFLHLVYSDGTRRFSVYLRDDTARPTSIRLSGAGGDSMASLNTGRLSAILVANDSAAVVDRLARVAQAVL